MEPELGGKKNTWYLFYPPSRFSPLPGSSPNLNALQGFSTRCSFRAMVRRRGGKESVEVSLLVNCDFVACFAIAAAAFALRMVGFPEPVQMRSAAIRIALARGIAASERGAQAARARRPTARRGRRRART
jgi:hypothetical protein